MHAHTQNLLSIAELNEWEYYNTMSDGGRTEDRFFPSTYFSVFKKCFYVNFIICNNATKQVRPWPPIQLILHNSRPFLVGARKNGKLLKTWV